MDAMQYGESLHASEPPRQDGRVGESASRRSHMLGTPKIPYNPELEFLLKENGEQAEIYSLLHEMAFIRYRNMSDYFNVPLIILTAIIGFITGIGLSYQYINYILGGSSVLVSIIKSVLAYKKVSERSENHRICSLQFGQISKEIKIELSLCRSDRQDVGQLLHLVKVKLKNLLEVAELIEESTVEEFKRKFPNCGVSHRRSLPSIFSGVATIDVKHSLDHKEYFDQKFAAETEMDQREARRKRIKEYQTHRIVREIELDQRLHDSRLDLSGALEASRIETDHESLAQKMCGEHMAYTARLRFQHEVAMKRMEREFEEQIKSIMDPSSSAEVSSSPRVVVPSSGQLVTQSDIHGQEFRSLTAV